MLGAKWWRCSESAHSSHEFQDVCHPKRTQIPYLAWDRHALQKSDQER